MAHVNEGNSSASPPELSPTATSDSANTYTNSQVRTSAYDKESQICPRTFYIILDIISIPNVKHVLAK